MVFASAAADSCGQCVSRTAIVRGRMMELLVEHSLPGQASDDAFVVGVFSMLDVLLNVPLPVALAELGLPHSIEQALLVRGGLFGPYLCAIEACEHDDWSWIDIEAERLGLSAHQICVCRLHAMAWAENLASG